MTLPDRFVRKVRVNADGCWVWTGATAHGYGKLVVGSRLDGSRRMVSSHRFAYEQIVGPIPPGLDLDHLCRNRACCNPAHLEPVTRAENVRRGRAGELAKARAAQITECPKGHPYTPDNIIAGRTSAGGVSRTCRQCARKRDRERYRRMRGLPIDEGGHR